MQTMFPTPRRSVRGLLSALPRWVRGFALVVLVLFALGSIGLASLTREPIRATIWQRLGQNCGAFGAQDVSDRPFVTDSATVLRTEDCFLRGYAHCQAVSLGYGWSGTDSGTMNTFVVEPAVGGLVGCTLADVVRWSVAPSSTGKNTVRCARVVREPDYSLRIVGCGGGEDIVINAPPDIPPTRSPNIPRMSVTLGGSVFAFDNTFGVYTCCDHQGWDYQGPYGPMWTGVYTGEVDMMVHTFNASSSRRVVGIVNSSPIDIPTDWTIEEAKAICGRFLPPDAKYQTTNNVGENGLAGIEDYYTSVSLANTVPSSYFTDWTGKPATLGTFYVVYRYYRIAGPNAPTIGQCRVGTDENWTLNLSPP